MRKSGSGALGNGGGPAGREMAGRDLFAPKCDLPSKVRNLAEITKFSENDLIS